MEATLGDTATRVTIWLAMLGYVLSVVCLLLQFRPGWAFGFYAAGLAAFVLHAVFAFAAFYDWSHTTAWLETRDQTYKSTGFDSGHGIYLNYALGVVGLLDTIRWQFTKEPLHLKSRWAGICLHCFFLFMIINGGIVFASGMVRWFTTLLLLGMVGALAFRLIQSRTRNHD